MEKIISQIYWDSVANTYMPGTHLKKTAKNHVHFKNNLMAAGQTIVSWFSSGNYQVTRQIPALPMLINGHSYKIAVKAQSNPVNTFVCRLRFFNLQGDEIDNKIFYSNQADFVYPKGAVSYTFEIINGGCIELDFDRVQIAERDMPNNIFDDIFFQDPINQTNPEEVSLILVADSKRSRKLWPQLKKEITDIPLQIVNISWQYDGNLTEEMNTWIPRNINHGFKIISTSPRFDRSIYEIKNYFPQFPILSSTDFEINKKRLAGYHKRNNWYSENIYDPDWLMIIQEIKDYFRK